MLRCSGGGRELSSVKRQKPCRNRFRIQAAPVLQGERMEKAIETLCSIEKVEDIASLADLLSQ